MAKPEYSKRAVNRAGERLRVSFSGSARQLDAPELDAARGDRRAPGPTCCAALKGRAGLRYCLRKAGSDERAVTQRLKRLDTIVEKLDHHPGTLTQMEDIGGVRAVLPDQTMVDAVVVSLKRRWNVRRLRQYIDGREPGPKSDGYRAVHVIVIKDDRFIEIQLRTGWQDRWAQAVERDTRRLGEPLKFGGGADDLRAYYRLAAEQMAATAAGRTVPIEVRKELLLLYHATAHYYDSDDNDS